MNTNIFLPCLSFTGIDTGVSVLGMYSFSSGDKNIIYNQIYPTGYQYYNNIPYRSALPLIYNGTGSQPSGILNKKSFYQISDIFTQDFSSLIYLNYSGCLNSGSLNYLLASTTPNFNNSGAVIGISPSSRIFMQSNGYSSTISKEIGAGDFVFLSVKDNRFINFGLFSIVDNAYYSKSYDAGGPFVQLSGLCFGGALNYQQNFTGYSGNINEIYLFSGLIKDSLISNCVDCSFATGYSYYPISYPYTQGLITGSSWSGVYSSIVTGTQKVLSSYQTVTGGTGYVYYDSGITGNVLQYQSLVPSVQSIAGTDYISGIQFSYNNLQRLNGILSDFYFDLGLVSGDVVEIYSYPYPNPNLGVDITGFQYPNSSSFVQLFGNGLAETSGIDYGVSFNNLITNFDSSDVLIYDLYSGATTLQYNNSYVYTGSFYSSSYINLTGASGVDFSYPFNFDIYFDGQKMASGVDYFINQVSPSNSNVISSGNLIYNLSFFDINAPTNLEIKFVPFNQSTIRTLVNVTSNTNYVSGVTGFSEQIWVNGIRQRKNSDYLKYQRCRFCTGDFSAHNYLFTLYNSLLDTNNLFS